jgi:AI-2 transport protein TqsA
MGLNKFTSTLISLCLIFYLLYIGKSFFLPFLIALVIWYLIIALTSAYKKISLGKKQLSSALAMLMSITSMMLFIFLFMMLINDNVGKVIEVAPSYQEKFQSLSDSFIKMTGFTELAGISELIQSINISWALKTIAGMFTTVAGYTGMIVVYILFLLLEYKLFGKKIKMALKNKEAYANYISIISKIDKDIKTYIKIKTLASFSTAILSYLVLMIVGVDFAVFWALIIFLLNYIPTVGSIVAIFFPIVLSLIQFNSLIPFFIVTTLLIAIQAIIGNVLEPKFMGKSLNLSPLVIIISLTIWGSIWGIVGMFLCVPIMVIINIVLAKFKKTQSLAIMLSARGKVE